MVRLAKISNIFHEKREIPLDVNVDSTVQVMLYSRPHLSLKIFSEPRDKHLIVYGLLILDLELPLAQEINEAVEADKHLRFKGTASIDKKLLYTEGNVKGTLYINEEPRFNLTATSSYDHSMLRQIGHYSPPVVDVISRYKSF